MSVIKSQIGMQQVVSASLRKVLSDAFGTYTVIIEAFVGQQNAPGLLEHIGNGIDILKKFAFRKTDALPERGSENLVPGITVVISLSGYPA